jgi:hypothetical protein
MASLLGGGTAGVAVGVAVAEVGGVTDAAGVLLGVLVDVVVGAVPLEERFASGVVCWTGGSHPAARSARTAHTADLERRIGETPWLSGAS